MLKWFLKSFVRIARYGRVLRAALPAVLLLLPASPLWAQTAGNGAMEDGATIRAAIAAAVRPRLAAIVTGTPDVAVGAIDPRLRFPACPALQVTLPPANAAAMTAKVSCDAPAWTFYVPVRVQVWTKAVVAATNLAPDTRLNAADLALGRVDAFASSGALVTDPAQAEGKILRAGLSAGAPVLATLLALPVVVHRGDKVVLTLKDPSMTIRTAAVALEDGHVGESILVQNVESKKTIRATVAGSGTVVMKF